MVLVLLPEPLTVPDEDPLPLDELDEPLELELEDEEELPFELLLDDVEDFLFGLLRGISLITSATFVGWNPHSVRKGTITEFPLMLNQ